MEAQTGTAKDELLTIAETMAVLKISRSHVYVLQKRGALDFVKLGRSARIRQSTIDRLVKNGAAAQ